MPRKKHNVRPCVTRCFERTLSARWTDSREASRGAASIAAKPPLFQHWVRRSASSIRWIGAASSISIALAGFAEDTRASAGGPLDNYAGNPPQNQNCTACHVDFPVNSGNGGLFLEGLPASFVPGAAYDLEVVLFDPDQVRWGFELTVIAANPEEQAGTLVVLDASSTQLSDSQDSGPDYLKHTITGTRAGLRDGPSTWAFRWIAPELDQATFYVAGNAANFDGWNGGDYIYTRSFPLSRTEPSSAPVRTDQRAGSVTFAPNPVRLNEMAWILLDVPWSGIAAIDLYDVRGRNAAAILNEQLGAGLHRVEWSAKLLPGVYWYRVRMGQHVESGRIVVVQ